MNVSKALRGFGLTPKQIKRVHGRLWIKGARTFKNIKRISYRVNTDSFIFYFDESWGHMAIELPATFVRGF